MSTVTAEQAEFLLNVSALPSLKNEHGITMKILAALPSDKGDFRPYPLAMSAMDLAWHIASVEMFFLDAVITGAFDFSSNPRPENLRTTADVAEWYSENFESRMAKLTAISGEQLAQIIDFGGMFQMPAVMYLNFDLHHLIHHRGQLSTYIRPMGGKVPAIYGESHDSAEARKAAAQ